MTTYSHSDLRKMDVADIAFMIITEAEALKETEGNIDLYSLTYDQHRENVKRGISVLNRIHDYSAPWERNDGVEADLLAWVHSFI